MSDIPKNIEEQPKEEVAKSVITAKRKYFVPSHGVTIEADSLDEAVKTHEKNLTKEKAANS